MSVIFRVLYFGTLACLAFLITEPLSQPEPSWSEIQQGIQSGLFTALVWGGLSIYVVPKRLREDELGQSLYRRRWGLIIGALGLVLCGSLGPLLLSADSADKELGWLIIGAAALPFALLLSAAIRRPRRLFGDDLALDIDQDAFPDGGLAPPPGTDIDKK